MITRLILLNENKGDLKMKVNKKFEMETLKKYLTNGAKLKINGKLNTFGTCGSGYVRRAGFTLITPDGTKHDIQIIFTSKKYGTITTDIKSLNERYLSKYDKYVEATNEWLHNNIWYLLEL